MRFATAALVFFALIIGAGELRATPPSVPVISTVAGGGIEAAFPATIWDPTGIAVDANGNLYVADRFNHRVHKVYALSGISSIVAGTGVQGFSGDGGAATGAKLDMPTGVAVDASGNLYIADGGNLRIRKVAAGSEIISTVAGNGSLGFSGDGGLATAATLASPVGIAVDASGNLHIADTDNGRVRKIDAGSGTISTVAGNGSHPFGGDGGPATSAALSPTGLAFDGSGNLYIADAGNGRIRRVDVASGFISTVAGDGSWGDFMGEGGPATAAHLNYPLGVAIDASGNLYIADHFNHRIRRVDAVTGTITTSAGSASYGFSGDGGAASAATLGNPYGVAVDASGNLYFADSGNGRVRKIDAGGGNINTVAGPGSPSTNGDGGLATAATLADPSGVTIDASGNLLIADTLHGRVRKVDAGSGFISTVAGNGSFGFGGDGGAATDANLHYPAAVALDKTGNLYIADSFVHRIRRVDAADGIISTVAGNGSAGFNGDGGAATGASLSNPTGVTIDSSGNLYIADRGNARIRKVHAGSGIISTVAGNGSDGFSGDGGPATGASLSAPSGIAVDTGNNLYIADEFNNRIRRVDAGNGFISTVAGNGSLYSPGGDLGDGGAATAARVTSPRGVAIDASGNLYIAEYSYTNRIRKVDLATGTISTVAGNGTYGFSGDGGYATQARLAYPNAVALDASGNLYIADKDNRRIRRVSWIPATVPGAPVIGAASTLNAGAMVSFTAPTFDGFSVITTYIATCNPGGVVATGTSSPITVTGLTNAVTYSCVVNAANAVGTGPSSAPSNSFTPDALSFGQLAVRYRLFSPFTLEHLYTTDQNEYNVLPVCCAWVPEGTAYRIFNGPGSLSGVGAVPYYRLYNPYSNQHHWTTDAGEYNFLATLGWRQEGTDGFILPAAVAGAVPLYRLYINAFGGLHLWTTDPNEVNYLTSYAGWIDEGIAGYVIPMP